jgi:hypothetical protein
VNRYPVAASLVIEFRKIIDHRGTVISDPVATLAPLQLGRAYVASGETTKAKRAYQDFLILWKNADSDIPILQRGRLAWASARRPKD